MSNAVPVVPSYSNTELIFDWHVAVIRETSLDGFLPIQAPYCGNNVVLNVEIQPSLENLLTDGCLLEQNIYSPHVLCDI